MGRNNIDLEKIVKERCENCPALVEEKKGTWFCDEMEKPCEEVIHCPEGLKLED